MQLRYGYSMNFMMNIINKKIKKTIEAYRILLVMMIKYFFVALFIVGIEIFSFSIIIKATKTHYIVAVIISFIVATILNWFFSRKFVFKSQEGKIKKEIILVFAGSLVGCLLQVAVTFVSVEQFKMLPVYGKIISMTITFFWNFWFRLKFVFK